jgi:hypothetical protein
VHEHFSAPFDAVSLRPERHWYAGDTRTSSGG